MWQVYAAYSKRLKEVVRNKAALFWTMAWPMIWLIISTLTFTSGVPEEVVPYVKGSMTVSMMVFALMIACMSNLPASIAGDRKDGLLAKLRSMPINPYRDFLGRLSAIVTFSLLAAALVLVLGVGLGARFAGSVVETAQAVGFLFVGISAAAGVGLIIGTLIKNVQGAIMSGVGISVITAAISGLFAPYDMLPPPLQLFSRVYPISSSQASILYLVVGSDAVGYDPLTSGQVALTVALSFALLLVGTILYSRLGWRID